MFLGFMGIYYVKKNKNFLFLFVKKILRQKFKKFKYLKYKSLPFPVFVDDFYVRLASHVLILIRNKQEESSIIKKKE